jgi:hypothetical protein
MCPTPLPRAASVKNGANPRLQKSAVGFAESAGLGENLPALPNDYSENSYAELFVQEYGGFDDEESEGSHIGSIGLVPSEL